MGDLQNKLCWSSADHYKYSSCWSILTKLCILNQISPRFLYKNICTNEYYSITAKVHLIPHWNVQHFNVGLISQLTGLSELDVRDSFVDSLQSSHVLQQSNYLVAPSVRHCPDCIKMGFHCVYFLLPTIFECPIHGQKLLLCSDCTTFLRKTYMAETNQTNKNNSIIGLYEFANQFAPACGHLSYFPNLLLPGRLLYSRNTRTTDRESGLSATANDRVIRNFEGFSELSEWFSSHTSGGLREVVSRILRWSCIPSQSSPDYEKTHELLSAVLGFYEAVFLTAPFFTSWSDRIRTKPIFWVADRFSAVEDSSCPDLESLSSIYKSIRRHIRKIDIKFHSRCLSEYLRFESGRFKALSFGNYCPACVAFLTWRSIYEECTSMDDLVHGNRLKIRKNLRFLRPMSDGKKISKKDFAQLVYASFFSVLYHVRAPGQAITEIISFFPSSISRTPNRYLFYYYGLANFSMKTVISGEMVAPFNIILIPVVEPRILNDKCPFMTEGGEHNPDHYAHFSEPSSNDFYRTEGFVIFRIIFWNQSKRILIAF
jgi:hypothetical protein